MWGNQFWAIWSKSKFLIIFNLPLWEWLVAGDVYIVTWMVVNLSIRIINQLRDQRQISIRMQRLAFLNSDHDRAAVPPLTLQHMSTQPPRGRFRFLLLDVVWYGSASSHEMNKHQKTNTSTPQKHSAWISMFYRVMVCFEENVWFFRLPKFHQISDKHTPNTKNFDP